MLYFPLRYAIDVIRYLAMYVDVTMAVEFLVLRITLELFSQYPVWQFKSRLKKKLKHNTLSGGFLI